MSAVISAIFLILASSGDDFYVSLEEVASPLRYSVYKIEIFRNSGGAFITLKDYKSKNLTKKMDYTFYIKTADHLMNAGIYRLRSASPNTFQNHYYVIEYAGSRGRNRFYIEKTVIMPGESVNIVRSIKNAADLVIYDLK